MSAYENWSRAGWRAHLPGIGDVSAYVAGLGEATIHGLAAASADRVPDRIALDIDGEEVTYATLDGGAARVAGWLSARLAPGDRVLIAARSSPGFVRCYLGALRAGAVVVLTNPGYPAAELVHLVTDSRAAIAFADGGPARLLASLPSPRRAKPGPPGQHRAARLHLRHDRSSQGRAADSPPADHLDQVGHGRVAVA